jgi:hypothetical protein
MLEIPLVKTFTFVLSHKIFLVSQCDYNKGNQGLRFHSSKDVRFSKNQNKLERYVYLDSVHLFFSRGDQG